LLKQRAQHMKKVNMWSHFCTFTHPQPCKAIHLTYERSWHVESLLWIDPPVPYRTLRSRCEPT
jgi:hypothetical protein